MANVVCKLKEEFTDKCGAEIVLTEKDIARIEAKHPDDIGRYRAEIQGTLEDPDVVYEGKYEDTLVFYGKGRMPEDSRFGGCYVAVAVRYSETQAFVRTVYFPINMNAALGDIFYINPRAVGSW